MKVEIVLFVKIRRIKLKALVSHVINSTQYKN